MEDAKGLDLGLEEQKTERKSEVCYGIKKVFSGAPQEPIMGPQLFSVVRGFWLSLMVWHMT